MRFPPNFTSFYESPSFSCFFSFSPSSSAFPSVTSLSSSAVSHSLRRGRISCSEVSWFLGGVRSNPGWNQLVCYLIQEGETQAKEEGPMLGQKCDQKAGRRVPKGNQDGPILGHSHQGSPKDRGAPEAAQGLHDRKWSWLPWRLIQYYCQF